MKKTRVFFCDPGSFTLPYNLALLTKLARKGFSVSYYGSRTQYNPDHLKEIENLSCYTNLKKISGSSKLYAFLQLSKLLLDLNKRSNRNDIIILNWSIFFPLEFLFCLILKIQKKRIIYTEHNIVEHGTQERIKFKKVLLYHAVWRVMVVSEYTKSRVCTLYNLRRSPILAPHGAFSPCATPPSLQLSKDFNGSLVFIGNVKPYKGIIQLSKNLSSFKIKEINSIEIYGKWDKKKTLAASKEMLIKEGVHIQDRFCSTEELNVILSEGNLFILPYSNASQSGVFFNILHYARPFIATNKGEIGNFLIRHQLEDLIFEFGNEASIRKATDFAIRNYVQIHEELLELKKLYNWDIHELTKEIE